MNDSAEIDVASAMTALTAAPARATTLAGEVRATLLLFAMVVGVIIGFTVASSLVLRLLAS